MIHPHTIRVWPWSIRLFHWSLVAAFAIDYLTQEQSYELHVNTGYVILALLTFRLIIGFTGTPQLRFRNFTYPATVILHYLGQLIRLNSPRFLGHNPAGGAMIIALLANLLIITLSGIALDGAENRAGLLATTRIYRYTDLLHDIHDSATVVILILIGIHICGVILQSYIDKENLIKAMVTGRKIAEKKPPKNNGNH